MRRLLPWLLLSLLGLLTACSDPTEWEPRGEVRWVQWRETNVAGGRVGQATFEVLNTGKVTLASADLAVKVATDKDLYFAQVQVKPDLPPGKSSYGSLEVPFQDPEDRGSLAGVSVESVAFH